MTQARPSLDATTRTELGKAAARLRTKGRIPAVLYGHGPSVSITIGGHELENLRKHTGANSLVDLAIDGAGPSAVLVHGIQIDKVTRKPVHVDFVRVQMSEDMTVDVAVHPTGTAEAVERHGGTLLHSIDHIRVRARPDNLPSAIEIDVAVLATFDDVIRAGDLVLPAGVALVTDPDEIVLRVNPPRVIEGAIEAPAEIVSEPGAEA